jgi:AcrR family transcriptional regulator
MARRGRRPGDPNTRGRILEAARRAFARDGFRRTTIRLIAAEAEVDPALVYHYFRTKEDLFAAAVHIPFGPTTAVEGVFAPGVAGAGERLAQLFFAIWEAEPSREALLGQLRRAMSDPEGPVPMVEFVTGALLPRVASHLPGDDRELRVEMAVAQLLGIAFMRYALRLEPLASTPVQQVIAQVAPRLEDYLDSRDG